MNLRNDLALNDSTEVKDIIDNETCLFFICSGKTYIPHQIGFQRLRPSDFEGDPVIQEGAEKVIDLHGHIVGVAVSPDAKELYVNVRSWPANCRPSMENAPCISSQIELRVIDLQTFTVRPETYLGHRGFTPSENAFYLYLDVSATWVGSGSEDNKGYIWDR